MTASTITITVRLFAGLAQQVGTATLTLSPPEGAHAADVLEQLCENHPPIAAVRSHLALAVNQQYTSGRHRLADGDELALISPVSGG